MIKSTRVTFCLDKPRIENPTKSLVIQIPSRLRVFIWNISDEYALVNGSSIFNSFLMPKVESLASISLNLSNGMEWGMWVDEGPRKKRQTEFQTLRHEGMRVLIDHEAGSSI